MTREDPRGPERTRDYAGEDAHLERLVLELDLARLNLGDVEDVVDQVQQVLRRHDGVAHVLTRQLWQLVAHGELQHAEHAVERRPHLVRHGGEEVPLCVVGCAHLGCVELRALDILSLGAADAARTRSAAV